MMYSSVDNNTQNIYAAVKKTLNARQSSSTTFSEHLQTKGPLQIKIDWLSDEDNKILNEVADSLNLSNEERYELDMHIWDASIMAKKSHDHSNGIEKTYHDTEEMIKDYKQFYSSTDSLSKSFKYTTYRYSELQDKQFLLKCYDKINELLTLNRKPTIKLQIDYS